MSRVPAGELPATEIVLGLVIDQPDTPSDLERRLAESYPAARFAGSAAHNAIERLERAGFVGLVDGSPGRYAATPKGISRFRKWRLTPPSTPPPQREAVHGMIRHSRPEDLPRLIESVAREEQAFARDYAKAHSLLEETRLKSDGLSQESQEWSTLMQETVIGDEVLRSLSLFKRRKRLRKYFEGLHEQARRRSIESSEGSGDG